jgi:hypothetical protein
MNKRFEAGAWGAETRKANSGRCASAGSSGRRKQIAKVARSISTYRSNKTQSMSGGTVYRPAALLGAFRRGNNPRFYRGKKNSFSMRLSEGKQML